MPDSLSNETAALRPDPLFPSTMWSAVRSARDGEQSEALLGLERLAVAYWRPLYVFVRQRGITHHDATDAVQGFLAHLLARDFLRRVERRETRFRTFLITAFKNWLADEQARAQALKRGGGAKCVPLAEFDSLQEMPVALSPAMSAEESFDREWASRLFDQAMAQLAEAYSVQGRSEFFNGVRGVVFGGDPQTLEALAGPLGLTPGGLRKAVHTLRGRFAELLRAEVARLVATPGEVEDELKYLLQLLSR